MDHKSPSQATSPPVSRTHSEVVVGRKAVGGGEGGGGHSSTTTMKSKQIRPTDIPNSRSSSDKENANVSTTTSTTTTTTAPVAKPRPRRSKVRFTDMEPEPTPLLSNARDSMYMRAELQRELDFGIPAQEEAHRYAKWCEEEARREAAQAEPSGSNYAKADTVVHPKRLSTDLSSMDIDFANLGEEVSGLDVFSRVEVALGKQQEAKRKVKAQKEKEKKEKRESTREKLKATLLSSPKRENSFSSMDEPAAGEPAKEKKGSRFLRKVISDRVIKPKEGTSSRGDVFATAADEVRSKEIESFFGKLAAQPAPPGQLKGAPLPLPAGKPPTMERAHSDTPEVSRKDVPSRKDVAMPTRVPLPAGANVVPEGRRPSHPDLRPPPPPPPANANGRPPSKSEPPPPPPLQRAPPLPQSQAEVQAPGKAPVKSTSKPPSTPPQPSHPPPPPPLPTIRAISNTSSTKSNTEDTTTTINKDHTPKPPTRKPPPPPPSRPEQQQQPRAAAEDPEKRRPSLPTHHTYPASQAPFVPSHSHSLSTHTRTPSQAAQNGSIPTHLSPAPGAPRDASPSHQKSVKPPSHPAAALDDVFSRIEQDIARSHPPPPVKEKHAHISLGLGGHHGTGQKEKEKEKEKEKGREEGGDERARDKGRKLFGKAVSKVKEKMEKERAKG